MGRKRRILENILLEDLQECSAMRRIVDDDKEFLIRMRAHVEGTTSVLRAVPISGGTKDKIGEAVANIDALEARIAKREAAYTGHLLAVENIIGQLLDDRHLRIIRLYYIEGKTMDEVAVSESYSRSRCYDFLNEALETLGIDKVRTKSDDEV